MPLPAKRVSFAPTVVFLHDDANEYEDKKARWYTRGDLKKFATIATIFHMMRQKALKKKENYDRNAKEGKPFSSSVSSFSTAPNSDFYGLDRCAPERQFAKKKRNQKLLETYRRDGADWESLASMSSQSSQVMVENAFYQACHLYIEVYHPENSCLFPCKRPATFTTAILQRDEDSMPTKKRRTY